MAKYVVRKGTDWAGNQTTEVHRQPTAYEVGSAIGTGVGLLLAANKNAQSSAIEKKVELAVAALENRQYEKALGYAEQLIGEKDKRFVLGGRIAKARALEGQKQYKDAIHEYGMALELAQHMDMVNELSFLFVERCVAYEKNGELGAAIRDATRVIQIHPNDEAPYLYRGLLLKDIGDLEQSLKDLTKAIQLAPGENAAFRERAELHRTRKDFQAALADFERAMALDGSDAYCYRLRGDLYMDMGEHRKAIGDYSKAIKLDPASWIYYELRAKAYEQVGEAKLAAADRAVRQTETKQKEAVSQAFDEYFDAADELFEKGILRVYTEADAMSKPNWGFLWGAILVAIVLSVVMLTVAASRPSRDDGIGYIAAIFIMIGIPLFGWTVSSEKGTEKEKALVYLDFVENEQLPGFEQFFGDYLSARADNKLEELESRSQQFFTKGDGRAFVASIMEKAAPA